MSVIMRLESHADGKDLIMYYCGLDVSLRAGSGLQAEPLSMIVRAITSGSDGTARHHEDAKLQPSTCANPRHPTRTNGEVPS
jgi:hypothetical protein